ncbi:MAG: C25 family cysteine peptidase [Candidatus Lokiarchaeia archaeon]
MIKWINLKRKRGKAVLAILMMSLFLININFLTTSNQYSKYYTITNTLLYHQTAKNLDSSLLKDYKIGINTELAKDHVNSMSGCLTLEFEISSFNYEEGIYYFEGCDYLRSEGLPVLPYIHERFILPHNSVIENLQVDYGQQQYLFPKYIERFTETGTQSWDGESGEQKIDNSPEVFPSEPVMLSDSPSVTRSGVDLWHITIYPFRAFQNETVLLHKELTIRIHFKPDNSFAQSRLLEFTAPDFATNALSKFSREISELQLEQGVRTEVKGMPSYIVIGDYAIHSMAVASCFYWTPEGQRHYGLICLKPNETDLIPEFSIRLQEIGFNEPQIIDSTAELIALIEFSWNHAPYLVIADESLSTSATPLAAFLNYPLIVHPTVSNYDIDRLISQLGVSGIILCGNVTNIDLGNLNIIDLADGEEVNQFLYTFQYQTGFIEKEFYAYRNQFLATVLNGQDYTLFTNEDTQTRQGIDYLVCYDNSNSREFVTAATTLAAYRGAQIEDIGYNTSIQIRNLLDDRDPLYVAFYGDGDTDEAECYFVSDPTGDYDDPTQIATDFYYAERDECQPEGAWHTFSIDSYVGRPISTSDAYAQLYVDLIANYENGSLPNYNFTKRCALFSYGFGWEDATGSVHNKLVAAGANYHPIYERGSGYFTESTIIWELESNGIQIAYFNTHGNYNGISTGDGGTLNDYDLQGHNFGNTPPFIYVDACLTARFAGSGYEEGSCIATQFMKYGILGYLGSTMNAYVGEFDRFDKCFFEYFKNNESIEIGRIAGLALEDFYSGAAGNGLDDYEEKTILEVMLVGDPKLKLQFYGVPAPSPLLSLLPLIVQSQIQSQSVGGLWLQILGVVGIIGIVIIAIRGTGSYAEPTDWYDYGRSTYF